MTNPAFKEVMDNIVEEANYIDELWSFEFTPKEWSVVNTVISNIYDYCHEGMLEYGWKYDEFISVLEGVKGKLNQ